MPGWRFLPILAFAIWPLSAQRVLRPLSEIPAPGIANAVTMGATKCDAHGNIYIRIVSAPDLMGQVLTKIGRDGGIATFNPEKVTDTTLDGWSFKDFAITRDAVWVLAAVHSNQSYLLRFSPLGDYKRAVKIDADFHAEQFAVFDTGDFLISGLEPKGGEPVAWFQPVMAMFDKDGRFLKRLEVDEGDKKDEPKPASYAEASAAIALGTAETYGGEIYVLRAGATPVVLVISAAGTVARRIPLEPPTPDSKAIEMRLAEQQIVVEFVRPKAGVSPQGSGAEPVVFESSSGVFVVYDAVHGNRLGDYSRAPNLTGIFACIDGRGGFDFLGEAKSGTRAIIRAGTN